MDWGRKASCELRASSENQLIVFSEVAVVEIEKGPEPLVIDAAGRLGKGLAARADHEDAAFVLPLKGGLAGRDYYEDGTLPDADRRFLRIHDTPLLRPFLCFELHHMRYGFP